MKMSSTDVVALTVGLILVTLTGKCYGALEVGFYKGKCGRFTGVDVETIVAGVVKTKFLRDRSIAPALIRMQFHDCFVNGCDASILLDGSSSEKTAPPNLSVRGYDVIDSAKTILEGVCPGVVSCADIIIMATRDAVSMSGGVWYNVQTGRKDGFVSLASNVDLPAPSISVPQSVAVFAKKGLNTSDMVHLLGGHTVGVAHCNFFQNRLYNFQNTGKPDPTMDSGLLQRLRLVCPQNSAGTNVTNLDQNPRSSAIVDNSFYKEIVAHRGILQIDQEIAQDPRTQAIVTSLADDNTFNTKFGQAMVKLGTIQVLTGSQGEIRKSCRAVNGRRS